jgi:hypothetical protein
MAAVPRRSLPVTWRIQVSVHCPCRWRGRGTLNGRYEFRKQPEARQCGRNPSGNWLPARPAALSSLRQKFEEFWDFLQVRRNCPYRVQGRASTSQGMHGRSRASGLLTQRMRGRPNSISSDILIAHINGSMAGALADSEAAVNSHTLARPKRCENSSVVAKRSRPCTTTQPKQPQKNNERSASSGFRLRANAPEGEKRFPISPVRGGGLSWLI